MTNERIARGYFQEAEGRFRHLGAFLADKRFATVVREAQEVVELLRGSPTPRFLFLTAQSMHGTNR